MNINSKTITNSEEAEDWLVGQVALLLEVPEGKVNVREPLVNYGLSSAHGVQISGVLAEALGRPLEPTLLWDYPSIEEIAEFLFEEE